MKNKHHLIPLSRGGLNGDNKQEWEERKHKAYHALFVNALPHEALAYLFATHFKAFSKSFKNKMMDLLNMEPEDIYDENLYKKLSETPEYLRKLFSEEIRNVSPPE